MEPQISEKEATHYGSLGLSEAKYIMKQCF